MSESILYIETPNGETYGVGPTKVSQLENDSGFTTFDDLNNNPRVTNAITSWLDGNLTGDSSIAIDSSLSISNAAADAKAVGDRITALEDATIETDTTLSVEGAAADAKATGDAIAEVEENAFSEYARQFLIGILRHALYDSNQKTRIDMLEYELSHQGQTTYYSVSYVGGGFAVDDDTEIVPSGMAWSVGITGNNGKSIESVTVTMGGNTVSGAYENGKVTIPSVTGDIVITVRVSGIFTITNNLTGVSNSNSLVYAENGDAYVAVLSAESGLIDTVTITMGGNSVVDVTVNDYTYNIDIPSVSGDIVITAKSTEIELDKVYTIPMQDNKFLDYKGDFVDTSAQQEGASAWTASDRYLQIPDGTDYVRVKVGSGMKGYEVCFYDADKNFISRSWTGNDSNAATRGAAMCPQSAKYIRVGTYKYWKYTFTVDVTFCERLAVSTWNKSSDANASGKTEIGSVPSDARYVFCNVKSTATVGYYRWFMLLKSDNTKVTHAEGRNSNADLLVTIPNDSIGLVSYLSASVIAETGSKIATPENDIVMGWA